ncbi:thymidine phosphorylase [Actomonas aquatica]|uniref:thymidine phosphorylase n=1 Tax=Actomonas aquatica TaxID=2866162 RepID=A0ABZ1C3Y8_9BACT|nr:thymidine phosphorylase [Opitutus sp. WL0086]WRQ86412.1 thymidine phosphorylase [Opitutus sp. WL0086]
MIARKRDGAVLSEAEIQAFVRGATDGSWADYQLTAMLMAIYLNGMTAEETAAYTRAMMNSGVVADLSQVKGIKVDKHSTGGVGDKVSLPLAAMVVACGVPVPMISGRGLGHSGGTLDKLESIPGFNVNLSLEAYREQVTRIGCALIGQTADLAPSDKKLYALRDVTATVECVPLICGSIMCKKLAEGIDGLVLDVKYGRGAFMKEIDRARELAHGMVEIGREMGKDVRALITAMDQPLGRAVGNAVEVAESIACLKGEGPADLMEVTYALGVEMLLIGGAAKDADAAQAMLEGVVHSGAALNAFRAVIEAQGGNAEVCDDPDGLLPRAAQRVPLQALEAGVVQDVDAMAVALAALKLGAGRARAEDAVDHAVGITDLVKIGETVEKGQPLCVVHANDDDTWAAAEVMLRDAIVVGEGAAKAPPLIVERIG